MRLILIEPQLDSGHHPIYVRLIAEEALRRGWRVRLLTACSAPGQRDTVVLPRDTNLSIHRIMKLRRPAINAGAIERLRYQYRMFRAMQGGTRALIVAEPADFVFVANLDYFFRVAPFLGSPFALPFGGVLANVRFHLAKSDVLAPQSRRDAIDAWMFRRLLRVPMLRAVLTTDDTLLTHERDHDTAGSQKLVVIPELVTIRQMRDKAASRAALGLPAEAIVILCYGALSGRKGIVELLNAMRLPDCPTNTVVLLAGQQDDHVRADLRSPWARELRVAGRLHEIDRYLDGDEESLAFSASDIAWLGYVKYFGISGVTIQAAVGGLPSIACREGIIGHWVKMYEIGLTVAVDNPVAVVSAIRALSSNQDLRTRLAGNGIGLRTRHTTDGFATSVCNAIANNKNLEGGCLT